MATFEKLKGLFWRDASIPARLSPLRSALPSPSEDLQVRLWEAVDQEDLVAVEKAVRAGANPCQCSAQGVSALHVAARSGNLALLSVLLGSPHAQGPGVDEVNAQGFTPLSEACAGGFSGCVVVLLAAGANPGLSGPRGITALHRAAAQDNAEVLRVLFKAGASWHSRDIDGSTPLDVLAQHRPHAVNAWRRRAVEGNFTR